MKKNLGNPIPLSSNGITKLLLTMKLILIITFLSILQVNANVYSQNIVSLDVQNESISELLNTIENQTQVRFFYNNDLLLMSELISVKATDEKITELVYKVRSLFTLAWTG